MKRLLLAVAIIVACLVGVTQCGCSATAIPTEPGADSEAKSVSGGDSSFARAFADRAGNLELEGQGTVSELLTDDTDGARHQRFIVRLDSGQTLLVTHNIDIAPRVSALRVGDTVSFKGEYEWNAQGGLLHWTHHDPTGSHTTGWIRHDGRTYQ
jgi:Protein of unknown function (DUF3465)